MVYPLQEHFFEKNPDFSFSEIMEEVEQTHLRGKKDETIQMKRYVPFLEFYSKFILNTATNITRFVDNKSTTKSKRANQEENSKVPKPKKYFLQQINMCRRKVQEQNKEESAEE